MKPIGLFRRGGRVPKSFFFEKPNKTMSFFRNAFQSTLLKHAGEVFFLLRNADFFKFKNATDLSWGKILLIRALYREQIMHHGWSVNLTYCYRLSGLSAFSNRHTMVRKLCVTAKTEIWNSCEYQFNVKIRKLWKTWKYKNLAIKKIANLGIIHIDIKSAGRRYTKSLLVNYAGNLELRSFCCSMLHPNNACRKDLILSLHQRKKKSSIRRQWLPAKDLLQL